MAKLTTFNFITLNGLYKGPQEDTSWHRHGEEEAEYASGSMEGDHSILLFGRKTYESMASWWPSPMALETMPEVAAGMNRSEKIVFSKTLESADWENTTLIKGDLIDEIKRLKETLTKDLVVLGSSNLITQLADARLVDYYGIMIDPVALGNGTPFFNGLKNKLDLKLVESKVFKSGVVLLGYIPL
ncbi:dihydrofolate reductase family protein [Dyadobacter aurulentus]|uniref:dihydrofolate reductase family protein n=1 Tax=Dyadobacter sp. UC 10 TaxID=2605428 RepID=UPI0011F0AC35|nr:dihydrofolate reductase family protein [Dyadobacter sp. UC 10]KAA0993575.1 dihydrofolate reductase [Dyadobacter sp. UC 10]